MLETAGRGAATSNARSWNQRVPYWNQYTPELEPCSGDAGTISQRCWNGKPAVLQSSMLAGEMLEPAYKNAGNNIYQRYIGSNGATPGGRFFCGNRLLAELQARCADAGTITDES